MTIHDDWSDLAAERLDKIEQMQADKAEQAQRLDAVRSHLRIATETIEKQRRELERFRPVAVFADSRSFVLVKRLGQSPHELGEYASAPVTLYAKDDHA